MTSFNTRQPRISVVMGVFNGEDELRSTVESILNQSFDDFEFLIVDDGSTDRTPQILVDLAAEDSRIRVVSQANAGLTAALKKGCSEARGELIARQDVGDRSLVDRFRLQVGYLDAHPNVVAVGAGCRRIGPGGEFLGETTRHLEPREVTRSFLEEGVGISHTVAMFRRQAYVQAGGYREQFRFAQDTDLWHRISMQGDLAEIPEVAFEWGIDIDGISSSSHDRQRRLAELARLSHENRSKGIDDAKILEEARLASWGELPPTQVIAPGAAKADAEFFIGSQLYTLKDSRCRSYLWRSIKQRPMRPRSWMKYFISFVTTSSRDARTHH